MTQQTQQRNFKRRDYKDFVLAAKALGFSPDTLAEHIGYSSTAARAWADGAPEVAVMCAEAMLAAKAKTPTTREPILVIESSSPECTTVLKSISSTYGAKVSVVE